MIPSRNAGIEDMAKKLYGAWKVAYDAYRKQITDSGRNPDTDLEAIKAMPESIRFYPQILIYCDCCGGSHSEQVTFFFDAHDSWAPGEPYWKRYPRGFVEVAGTVYYGCKDSCAQALFMIHHQYAMREQAEESRFLKDPLSGRTIDLDRVVSLIEWERGLGFEFGGDSSAFFDTTGQAWAAAGSPMDNVEWRKHCIAAWKKRKVRT
jgi:hypothetical protein